MDFCRGGRRTHTCSTANELGWVAVGDLITFGEALVRLSPPDGARLETADRLDLRIAGAESNVAIAAARLGVESAWLSKLPASPLGRRVAGEIRRHGVVPLVSWDDAARDPRETSRQGIYYLEPGSKPRGTNVIYDRADAAITTADPSELDTAAIEEASMFFTTGITPALSSTLAETTARLCSIARAADTAIGFDLNYREKLWSAPSARACYERLLPDVDLLFAPERDARSVLAPTLGVEDAPEEDDDGREHPAAIARTLASRFDIETVVMTRGEAGAIAVHDGDVYERPAIECETVDPIGTGDAFVGGFLAEWLDDGSIEEALSFGAATAALKRTIPGDIAVLDRREVEAVLSDRSGGIDR